MSERVKVFICGACGKVSKTRNGFNDVACVMNAVLVWEDSIKRTDEGTFADPVPKEPE